MNLRKELTAWLPTSVYRPKARQSTTRMFRGGWRSSFSGRSCKEPETKLDNVWIDGGNRQGGKNMALNAHQSHHYLLLSWNSVIEPTMISTPPDDAHHFKPFDQGAEIRVFLVVLDETGLDPPASTFYVHARSIHLGQVNALQISQSPEQDLEGRSAR